MSRNKPKVRHIGDKNNADTTVKHGLFQRIDIDGIDGRTKLAKMAKEIEATFTDYGRHDSPEAAVLIKQITQKILRLEIFYANMEPSGSLDLPPAFLPLTNSLRLDMQRLADLAKEDDIGPTVADLIAIHDKGKK